MKKRNNKKMKVLSAERGAWLGGNEQLNSDISTGGQLTQLGGSLVQSFSNEAGDTADTVGSAIGGIGTGAAAGAALGSVGAIAGGLIGAVGGLVGANKRKKQEAARKKAIANQKLLQGSLLATNNLRGDYNEEYGQTLTLENGGQVAKKVPIYLNDGETVVRPDGTVRRIPKKGRPTDSVLTEEEVGAFVFGGVIDPDTKESYADMAEKLFKPTRKSFGEGIYAENTKKLNKLNAQLLFVKQEQTKTEQGITPKYKQVTQAADTGTQVLSEDEKRKFDQVYLNRSLAQMKEASKQLAKNLTIDPSISKQLNYDVIKQDSKRKDAARRQIRDKTSNILTDMAALSPVAYNFIQGLKTPEFEQPHLNLNTPTALSQVRNRFNLTGGRNALRDAANVGYYNVNTNSNTTGANMAQRAAIALGTQRSIVDLYDRYNAAETQAGNARANILMTAGQQDAAARQYSSDVNARNMANLRNFTKAGFEGISKYAQAKQQMRNQLSRDEMLMPFYKKYLSHGIEDEIINESGLVQ